MIEKSYAKINVFLKITATRGNYHEMISRFLRVPTLFDTLEIRENDHKAPFSLQGDFGCSLEQNTIFKAYRALLEHTQSKVLQSFCATHTIHVEKCIPSFAGLGGGSSNAATFLLMVNHACDLKIDTPTLAHISSKVGADLPFFIYGYPSANVEGIGEIITPFEEELPEIEIFTPSDIACDTVAVYKEYRAHHLNPICPDEHKRLKNMHSVDAYANMNISQANDLYAAAKALYPKLEQYAKEGFHFSGSGSSFFRINHG